VARLTSSSALSQAASEEKSEAPKEEAPAEEAAGRVTRKSPRVPKSAPIPAQDGFAHSGMDAIRTNHNVGVGGRAVMEFHLDTVPMLGQRDASMVQLKHTVRHCRGKDIQQFGAMEVERSVRWLLRLDFLSPRIIEAIAEGHQPPDLAVFSLMRRVDLPLLWNAQEQAFGLR
jgi:hypothetical protein